MIESFATYRAHVNGSVLFARPEIMGHPDATDLTAVLPQYSRQRKTQSSAIKAGRIVDVSLAGQINAWRNELEKTLIGELCASGVEVWNLAHVEGRWKDVPVQAGTSATMRHTRKPTRI